MKIQHCMALVVLIARSLTDFRMLFMNSTTHSIRSISSSVILLLAISAHAATVWDGPTISFTKSNYANPLLAENQDRLTANVWITRGSSQGLFNANTESRFTHFVSPAGTEWANGSLENYATLSYTNWNHWATSVNASPPATVGVQAVLHLIADDIYLSVQFTSWTGGAPGGGPSYGGGFSYLRSTPVPEPQVNYAISGNTAYVTSSPNASGDIVSASTYNGYPVTSIGVQSFSCYAYSGCTNLTSVTIPNSVTSIGAGAFATCAGLTSMTLGNSVTNIGSSAFFRCPGLTSVTIPDSVTSIGSSAFDGCTSLTRVTIPNRVSRIGFEAFMNCTKVTNLTFLGNTPALVPYPTNSLSGRWFANVGAGAKAYYYCGTTGWGATYGGLPTVMLCPPQIAPGGVGMKPGGFGFTLTRLTNQTIVVEASTNLANWQPIWTNTLPGASADFVDPEWLQHPNRFYRARSD